MICSKIKKKIRILILLKLIFLIMLGVLRFDYFALKSKHSDKMFLEYQPNRTAEFYLNPKEFICQNKNKQLFMVFVVIAPEHFDKRKIIRSTWGNNSLAPDDFRLIFSLGFSSNLTVNNLIVEEFKIHKDILQINNFTDSYYNMTTKIMKTFKWISKYCINAQYILRINDDVMVNTFSIINYFKNITYKKNQLFGHLLSKTVPIRFQHKHFVSKEQFPRDYYPDYPEGI